MSKALKRLMLNTALLSTMGAGLYSSDYYPSRGTSTRCKSVDEIPGYAHCGKSERELEKRREHRQKLKQKRNAKKGIYANKIKYHKNRKEY